MYKLGKYFLYSVCLVLIVFALPSCKQKTVDTERLQEDNFNLNPIFEDEDIDDAILELPNREEIVRGIEGETIADGPEIELNDNGDVGLSAQDVLTSTTGYIYYILHSPNLPKPWRLFCFNQATNVKTLIYAGKRRIQSVAGDDLCYNFGFAMSQTTEVESDYEIYRAQHTTQKTYIYRLTDNNVQDTNVSLSLKHNSYVRIVWQRPKQGRRTIYYRAYANSLGDQSFTQSMLTHTKPQMQPSVNGDGDKIVLIRKGSDGKNRVVLYYILRNTYKVIFTSSNDLRHPSVSNIASRVAWLQKGSSKNKIRVKDLNTGAITNQISTSSNIKHPHLARKGKWLTYGLIMDGSIDVFQKNIDTGVKVRGTISATPKNHLGMYWQEPSKFCDEGIIDNIDTQADITQIEECDFIGYLKIENTSLTNLNGLENITFVDEGVSIDNNPSLTSLSGLDNLVYLGDLRISNNPSLTSLKGLESLISTDQFSIGGNQSLASLSGLDNITEVYAGLIITGNQSLTSLSGLENLGRVSDSYDNGYFWGLLIRSNASLISLSGSEDLHVSGPSEISDNVKFDCTPYNTEPYPLKYIPVDQSSGNLVNCVTK